jgi:hypothetical protein
MAAYEERQAAALVEMDKLGLPALDARMDQNSDRQCELEDAIQGLPASLERVAALTLLAVVSQATWDSNFDWGASREGFVALTELRPFIGGAVAASVTEHLDNPRRRFSQSPLWCRYLPCYWDA